MSDANIFACACQDANDDGFIDCDPWEWVYEYDPNSQVSTISCCPHCPETNVTDTPDTSTPVACADIETTISVWGGDPVGGVWLAPYTNGDLEWIGCSGNQSSLVGCTSFFCAETNNSMSFGGAGGTVRALYGGCANCQDSIPTSYFGCATSSDPRGLVNSPGCSYAYPSTNSYTRFCCR